MFSATQILRNCYMSIAVLFVGNRLLPICADHVYCLPSGVRRTTAEHKALCINFNPLILPQHVFSTSSVSKIKGKLRDTNTDGTITITVTPQRGLASRGERIDWWYYIYSVYLYLLH